MLVIIEYKNVGLLWSWSRLELEQLGIAYNELTRQPAQTWHDWLIDMR